MCAKDVDGDGKVSLTEYLSFVFSKKYENRKAIIAAVLAVSLTQTNW